MAVVEVAGAGAEHDSVFVFVVADGSEFATNDAAAMNAASETNSSTH